MKVRQQHIRKKNILRCSSSKKYLKVMGMFTSRCLFTDDTLIKDLRVVTKPPTGSVTKLRESIVFFQKLKGKGFIVYPGHGETFELDKYNLELMINGDIPK